MRAACAAKIVNELARKFYRLCALRTFVAKVYTLINYANVISIAKQVPSCKYHHRSHSFLLLSCRCRQCYDNDELVVVMTRIVSRTLYCVSKRSSQTRLKSQTRVLLKFYCRNTMRGSVVVVDFGRIGSRWSSHMIRQWSPLPLRINLKPRAVIRGSSGGSKLRGATCKVHTWVNLNSHSYCVCLPHDFRAHRT